MTFRERWNSWSRNDRVLALVTLTCVGLAVLTFIGSLWALIAPHQRLGIYLIAATNTLTIPVWCTYLWVIRN